MMQVTHFIEMMRKSDGSIWQSDCIPVDIFLEWMATSPALLFEPVAVFWLKPKIEVNRSAFYDVGIRKLSYRPVSTD